MALNDNLEFGSHFNSGGATDWSGNGNNGTVTGATATTDKNSVANQALNFTNTTDKVSLGDVLDPLTSDYSYNMWVNLSTDAQVQHTFLSKGTSGDRILFYHEDISSAPNNGLIFNIIQGANNIFVRSEVDLENKGWKMITATLDRSGNCILYVDGVSVKTMDISAASGSINIANDFNIGFWELSTAWTMEGKVDEPRIWSRVLTPGEITELFSLYDQEEPSTGYANKVLGVVGSKIDGVDVANISKVNGI